MLFSSCSHIFAFFFNLSFVRNFCGYRKFDCTRIYANANFSKFTDLKNRGFQKFIYIVGQIFEPPDFWGLLILKNLHLHKVEYNRIFDIHRNFEQSLNWRKKQKCASLKKIRSIHFFWLGDRGSGIYIFSGEPHFLERGHKIFEFSNTLQARCACRMFWLVRNFCLAHKSFHFFQRVLAESVLHEKYKPRYAENFEQMLDLWTMQESLLFFGKKLCRLKM